MNEFIEYLTQFINESLDLNLTIGLLDLETDQKNIAIRGLPGSTTIDRFYDGSQIKEINLEIASKDKVQYNAVRTINDIAFFIENIESLKNSNFALEEIQNTSEPYPAGKDERNNWIYLLTCKCRVFFEEVKS